MYIFAKDFANISVNFLHISQAILDVLRRLENDGYMAKKNIWLTKPYKFVKFPVQVCYTIIVSR
jgi:hypothetical protein